MLLVNAYVTHRDPPPLSFPHTLRSRRDTSDPALKQHLQGFIGFIMDRGKRPMTQTRFHILGHLGRVHHQVAFEVDAAQMNAVAAWATAANALLFLPDATVRAPDGRVLVDPRTGEPERGAHVPYPEDAAARKKKSEVALAEMGIHTPASLPPVVAEVEVELRTPADVAARCAALFACALRAESIASKKPPIPVADIRKRVPSAEAAMSPKERAFFGEKKPAPQDVTNHLWRYEALAPLAWAIAAVGELPPPTVTCDVGALAKLFFDGDRETFGRGAKLRPAKEILDALDLHYRLHWVTTEARVKKSAPPAKLDPGVVTERHYALNWLVRDGDSDWDDVDTAT